MKRRWRPWPSMIPRKLTGLPEKVIAAFISCWRSLFMLKISRRTNTRNWIQRCGRASAETIRWSLYWRIIIILFPLSISSSIYLPWLRWNFIGWKNNQFHWEKQYKEHNQILNKLKLDNVSNVFHITCNFCFLKEWPKRMPWW